MAQFLPAQPVVVNGVWYPSMWEAEKATGVSRSAISKVRKTKGEAALLTHEFLSKPSTKRIKVEHRGEVFPSIRAWAKARGYKLSTAHYRAHCMSGVNLIRGNDYE